MSSSVSSITYRKRILKAYLTPTFNNVGSLVRQASGSGSMTYTGMTVSTRASILIAVVTLFVDKVSNIASVTWNGVAMNLVGFIGQDAAGNRVMTVWRLNKPDPGNKNLVVTLTGSTDEICVGTLEFFNVTDVNNFAGANTNGTPATSKSVNIVSNAKRHFVAGFGATLNNTNDNITMNGTVFTRLDVNDGGTPGNMRREIDLYAGAASVTVTANAVDAADEVWVCGVDLGTYNHGSRIITAAGQGTFIVPSDVTSLSVEAWGAGRGGNGAGSPNACSGPGGGYARSVISVIPGQTIYYKVGAGSAGVNGLASSAEDSWVSTLVSTSPTTSAEGCQAQGGQATDTSGTGAGTGLIGTTFHSGGNCRSSTNGAGGGGGAGSGGDGSFSIVDSDGPGGIDDTFGGGAGGIGGHGGDANATTNAPGTAPGGGGSGTWFTGNGHNGADGQVRFRW